MAKVTIRVYQNTNSKSLAFGKYYGAVKHTSTIDAATLCKHAAMDSGIEETHIAVVYDALLKQMKEQVCNGHPIKVDGLGTFKVGISSEGWSVADVQRRYQEVSLCQAGEGGLHPVHPMRCHQERPARHQV